MGFPWWHRVLVAVVGVKAVEERFRTSRRYHVGFRNPAGLCCESEFAQVTERNPGVRMRVTACDLVWCDVLW